MRRCLLFVSLTVAFYPIAALAQAVPDVPSARVGIAAGNIRLDGVFDEAAWSSAEPLSAFTMIEPSEDAAPTAATTVRVLVRPTEIFIGVFCLDSNADGIVSFTKQRDGSLRNEDNIKIFMVFAFFVVECLLQRSASHS